MEPNIASFWAGKNTVIIGASGFLGGWLARKLADAGANVIAISRSMPPLSQIALTDLKARVIWIPGDAASSEPLAKAARDHPIHAIFHLAALTEVNVALRNPEQTFHDTVGTFLRTLEFVRSVSPRTILVLASSDKAYGPQATPYREDMPLLPKHPYEVAKATQDLLAQSFAKMYGLRISITRCGNFFGPFHLSFERIIPYTARQVLKGEPPVLRSDGSAIRDFLYIEEAAHAHMLLAERLSGDPSLSGEAFNFSHEVSISMRDLVYKSASLMNSAVEPRILGTTQGEISRIQLDCKKARTRLGWRPPEFTECLTRTIMWYSKQLPQLEAAGLLS